MVNDSCCCIFFEPYCGRQCPTNPCYADPIKLPFFECCGHSDPCFGPLACVCYSMCGDTPPPPPPRMTTSAPKKDCNAFPWYTFSCLTYTVEVPNCDYICGVDDTFVKNMLGSCCSFKKTQGCICCYCVYWKKEQQISPYSPAIVRHIGSKEEIDTSSQQVLFNTKQQKCIIGENDPDILVASGDVGSDSIPWELRAESNENIIVVIHYMGLLDFKIHECILTVRPLAGQSFNETHNDARKFLSIIGANRRSIDAAFYDKHSQAMSYQGWSGPGMPITGPPPAVLIGGMNGLNGFSLNNRLITPKVSAPEPAVTKDGTAQPLNEPVTSN